MHWIHRDELGVFLNEAGLLNRGAEVGVASGEFSAKVLAHWMGHELILVDLWEPQPISVYSDIGNVDGDQHEANRAAARALAASDSRVRLWQRHSLDAAAQLDDGSLDFVYIDANHSYLAARDDLRVWYPKIRPGGLLAGHDYLDGVKAEGVFGVKTAVDEFASAIGLAPAFTITDAPWTSWWLRKPMGPCPPAHRITVVTAYDSTYAAIGALSRVNKKAYCGKHGYRFVCRTSGFDESRPPSWSKVRFVLDELDKAEWVFWTDADSIVMNSAVPVTRFIQDAADVVLSFDPRQGMNTGCFFARRSPWTRAFLERVYARTDCIERPSSENAAITSIYYESQEVREHVAVMPNKLFNAFPFKDGGYASGDFIVHFPGMRGSIREMIARNYAAMAR